MQKLSKGDEFESSHDRCFNRREIVLCSIMGHSTFLFNNGEMRKLEEPAAICLPFVFCFPLFRTRYALHCIASLPVEVFVLIGKDCYMMLLKFVVSSSLQFRESRSQQLLTAKSWISSSLQTECENLDLDSFLYCKCTKNLGSVFASSNKSLKVIVMKNGPRPISYYKINRPI